MSEESKRNEKVVKYGESKKGNFVAWDTIGVPHPYCITPKHLTGEHMYLGEAEIKEAEEKHGAKCDICARAVRERKQDKILSFKEHEQALLIKCMVDVSKKEHKEEQEELNQFAKGLISELEKDKIAGICLLEGF